MNMPGFTAEASLLSRPTRIYQTRAYGSPSGISLSVLPQAFRLLVVLVVLVVWEHLILYHLSVHSASGHARNAPVDLVAATSGAGMYAQASLARSVKRRRWRCPEATRLQVLVPALKLAMILTSDVVTRVGTALSCPRTKS